MNTYKATTVFKHQASNTKNEKKVSLKTKNCQDSIFFKNKNSGCLGSFFLQLRVTIKIPNEQKRTEKDKVLTKDKD